MSEPTTEPLCDAADDRLVVSLRRTAAAEPCSIDLFLKKMDVLQYINIFEKNEKGLPD